MSDGSNMESSNRFTLVQHDKSLVGEWGHRIRIYIRNNKTQDCHKTYSKCE